MSVFFLFLIVGIALLLISVSILFGKTSPDASVVISIGSLSGLFILGEILATLAAYTGIIQTALPNDPLTVGIPIIPFFNHPCTKFDPVSGYRWKPGISRTVKVANGNLVFDNRFQANAQGYISPTDYFPQKLDTTKTRFLVFGDSFTAAYYLKKTWTEEANDRFFQHSQEKGPELYNFGLNGGGITGWNKIFFNEIVPKYDFDGIVIAVFANDLSRDQFILHAEDRKIYFGWRKEQPKDGTAFRNELQRDLDSLNLILADSKLDSLINSCEFSSYYKKGDKKVFPFFQLLNRTSNWLAKQLAMSRHKKNIGGLYATYIDPVNLVTTESLKGKYGPEKQHLLEEMIQYAKTYGKEVIFAAIPEVYGIGLNKKGKITAVQQELAWLAQNYQAKYFDGYAGYADMDAEEVSAHFLPYDGHWNQKGSDKFAVEFERFFLQK